MTIYVEVSVRTFHTTAGFDMTPRVRIVVEADKLSTVDLSKMAETADEAVTSFPPDLRKAVRPMTLEEVKTYRDEEDSK